MQTSGTFPQLTRTDAVTMKTTHKGSKGKGRKGC
jgi:hypothetical protein